MAHVCSASTLVNALAARSVLSATDCTLATNVVADLTLVGQTQYQPLSYDEQLKIKQDVVRKAFANFSQLDESLIPVIGPTLPSPLQYGYRTKLTPHFQAPPTGGKRKQWKGKGKGVEAPPEINGDGGKQEKEWEVTIGFEQKGRKRIIDIEECPIATKVINEQMTIEREKVKR